MGKTYLKPNGGIHFRHIGSFTLLFFLVTLRPAAVWPTIPYSLAPVSLLVIAALFLYKVHITVGVKSFFNKYKLEIVLVVAYQTLCLISLFINQYRFDDMNSFIRLGVSFILIQSALPLSIALFLLPKSPVKPSLTNYKAANFLLISIVILIFAVLIWQIVDNQSAYPFYQYFLAGDGKNSPHLRSIFSIGTDLAAILSCISLTVFFLVFQAYKQKKWFIGSSLLVMGITSFILGVLSGQRIFVLGASIGCLCFLIFSTKHTLKSMAFTFLSISLISVGLIKILPTHFADEFKDLLPFVQKINTGAKISSNDFIPKINERAMRGRIEIWSAAINVISENPIFGMSNGGFRQLRQSQLPTVGTQQNTHNILLQSAIDAGALGFLIVITLIFRTINRLRRYPASLSLFLSIFAGLQVDNFTDHSLPWIIVISYCCISVFICESTKRHSKSTA